MQGNKAARDLVRHAFADVGGNGNRARSWAKFARRWPVDAQTQLLDAYPEMHMPVLLLWADEDLAHPIDAAAEALDLLPEAQLRTLPQTGFLIAYDDPVGGGARADLLLRVRALRLASSAGMRALAFIASRANETVKGRHEPAGERAALGRRDHQGCRQLPDLGRDRPRLGDPLAGSDQGRRRARQR